MTAKFRVFSGYADYAEKEGDRANEFIGEVEANGGTYLGSHSALGGSSSGGGRGEVRTDGGGIYYALTVVYDDGKDVGPTPDIP